MQSPCLRGVPLIVLATLGAIPALGQITSEEPPSGRTLPVAEQVEQEMGTARFRLGPLRLLPFFRLYNVGWTNNALVTSEGVVDDYTASVQAGARFVVPFGQKVFVRGRVAPTYDWYYETESLRGFGGNYSGELLGLFNRATFGAGGGYTERISTVSSEVARDVFNTTSTGSAKAEVKLFERLSLFGEAETVRLKQEDPNANTPGLAPVSNLDRTETAFRGGLRYAFSSVLSSGILAEEVKTRFDSDPELRDSDVNGLLFVVRYDRERFYLEGTVGLRDGKPVTPNEYFPEYREVSYGYFVSYFLTRTLEIQALGARRPEASLFLDNPYYFETRNAAILRLAVGRRLGFNISGELGSNRYVNPVLVTATGEIATRVDETRQVSAGFDFSISKAVRVGLTVREERYDSNIDYYDREYIRIYGGLTIAADFVREERR